MADNESPRAFRRERNLSNRNFAKRGSNRRRQSTESHSSIESTLHETFNDGAVTDDHLTVTTTNSNTDMSNPSTPSTTSSSMHISYSVNSDTSETSVIHKPMQKMRSLDFATSTSTTSTTTDEPSSSPLVVQHEPQSEEQQPATPDSPEPALLGVKQKRLLFENFQASERLSFKSAKYKSQSTQSLLTNERRFVSRISKSPSPTSSSSGSGTYFVNTPKRVLVMGSEATKMINRHSSFHTSIDEERSEDEVDCIGEEVQDCQESADDDFGKSGQDSENSTGGKRESVEGEFELTVAAVNTTFLTPFFRHSQSQGHDTPKEEEEEQQEEQQEVEQKPEAKSEAEEVTTQLKAKDFPRNYRSRPLTEISGSQTLRVRGEKYNSLRPVIADPEDEEQIEMRDKGYGCIQPILEELIKTEETYVENLWTGINNYGNIFERKDLPMGLRGKKYVLFGNVEQIAEFHRDEFLPMLQRNRHDLKRLFNEFQQYVEHNCFYGYVLYTMNKQSSLKLCDIYKNYFKLLQTELDDKLGINSFLVQPIQRMARYPLLLTQFITTLFKNRDFVLKPIIESCCRLEKKLRTLLTTTNESEIINDIVCLSDTHEFNTFYQGKFRKVSEFNVVDHTLKRSYRSKVFIFDKCIIYTEIKGKQLIFHGRYPCEHIGITAKTKSFTLYYEHRKKQECDFQGDPALIEQWLDLIREMICSYAEEERKKFKEMRALEHGEDHMHPKPANLSLFRDSNRFSTDSGIGNIWVVPKPESDETNRTTWYAVT